MEDYRKMYTTLFNSITDAIACIEESNFGAAKEILICAQKKTEELFISGNVTSFLSIGKDDPDRGCE